MQLSRCAAAVPNQVVAARKTARNTNAYLEGPVCSPLTSAFATGEFAYVQIRRPAATNHHRPGSAAVSSVRPAGQARSRGDQADGDAAGSLARLFARRGRPGAGDRGRSQPRVRL